MAREAYYFPHDYNARNDRKLARLLLTHGVGGLGAYWCIVEMLYEEGGYLNTSDIPNIARELRMRVKTLQDIIENFELFKISGGQFFSLSAIERLKKRIARSESARIGAAVRWGNDANAMQSKCERNARKERKVKEIKEEESKVASPCSPPEKKTDEKVTTETDFLDYVEETKSEFRDLDCEVEFRKFKLYWSEGGRKLKRPKTAWYNWLIKAREIKGKNNKEAPTWLTQA